ncbi:hypothetical protein BpHYR1_013018 [Brachionus plicatilis]|uniref:Uncharacterized protein n=1 Tax=Brachionus plicatilis TaxID=10195 RepID=A0A3M7R2F2_BRAPC|nr:hypothetical protein BpHYR1_013018 [Brachionus plicatilis]
MTGESYIYKKNCLNLILFVDSVTYNKSGTNSIWNILSAIVELPPILRASFENIIFNSSWTGSQPDFNLWLQKYAFFFSRIGTYCGDLTRGFLLVKNRGCEVRFNSIVSIQLNLNNYLEE